MNNKVIIPLILAAVVTIIIFLSSIYSLTPSSKGVIYQTNIVHCFCGGCCVGCPGDCNNVGTPFLIYYWGQNGLSNKVISEFSPIGALINLIIWAVLMFIIYKFIWKRLNKH